MELWEVLSNRRKEIGMSFDELHNKTNLSISTLKKILGGHVSAPSFESIRAIAYAMDITLADIDHRIEYSRDNYNGLNAEEAKRFAQGVSNAAMALAILFDKLDDHGQEILLTIAKIEFNRVDLDNAANGIDILESIGAKRIGSVNDMPLYDAGDPAIAHAKYFARTERAEMEAEVESESSI